MSLHSIQTQLVEIVLQVSCSARVLCIQKQSINVCDLVAFVVHGGCVRRQIKQNVGGYLTIEIANPIINHGIRKPRTWCLIVFPERHMGMQIDDQHFGIDWFCGGDREPRRTTPLCILLMTSCNLSVSRSDVFSFWFVVRSCRTQAE